MDLYLIGSLPPSIPWHLCVPGPGDTKVERQSCIRKTSQPHESIDKKMAVMEVGVGCRRSPKTFREGFPVVDLKAELGPGDEEGHSRSKELHV